MIPHSGIDEVGSTSGDTGKFRFLLNVLRGFEADGGHLETKTLSPTGQVIRGPLHRHIVSVDFLRVQLGAEYQFAENWHVRLSVPYDIKNQNASIEKIAPTTPVEQQAILRNQNIHHRDEGYRGFADFSLLVSRQMSGLLRDDDQLFASLGTSIPVGKTEEDPWRLGEAGKEHLHIQFGTGTFNPLAELRYSMVLFGDLSLSTSVRGLFPFYANTKTYRSSVELSGAAEVQCRAKDWLAFHTGYFGLVQSYARWDGRRDINSGLIFNIVQLGVTVNPGYGMPLRLNVMFPFHGRTLSDEGDAFEHGPTISLMTSHSF